MRRESTLNIEYSPDGKKKKLMTQNVPLVRWLFIWSLFLFLLKNILIDILLIFDCKANLLDAKRPSCEVAVYMVFGT
jgi:hypothetical protein